MDLTFDTYDFSTTSDHEEEDYSVGWEATIGIISLFIVISCCVGVRALLSRKQRKDQAMWEALADFNHIRSNFKSIESLKVYLSQQTTSYDMFFSILFSFLMITLNTYTNAAVFWHYSKEDMNDDILPWLVQMISSVEIIFSAVVIIMPLNLYLCKYYKHSVYLMITKATNISALIYFTFANIEVIQMAKSYISARWESKRIFIIKLIGTLPMILVILSYGLMGVTIFVVKVKQLSYIYDKDIFSWKLYDYIVVFGVSRQFASLYSIGIHNYCWNFVFVTLHPTKKKEMRDADPKWQKKFHVDKIVCRVMIENYGLWGYAWLCYTFSNLENVKKLYIEHSDGSRYRYQLSVN